MREVNLYNGKNILVVDDCNDNLLLMELLLQSEGYKVTSADSGMKGLAEIEKQVPDLIILDLMMPDISGLEIVRHLKSKRHICNIPIILLTANSDFGQGDIKDIDALCYKPFNIDYILRQIQSILVPNFRIAA